MRAKTYGKKPRTGCGPCAAYNATLSPLKTDDQPKHVLVERSGNIPGSSPPSEKSAKAIPGTLGQPNQAKIESSEMQFQETAQKSACNEITSTPLRDECHGLSAAFARIEIKEPRTPFATPKLLQAPSPITSPIRIQPVTLKPAVVAYLEPLLSIKHMQPHVEVFDSWLDNRCSGLSLTKIGEGSFGEVYRASHTSITTHDGMDSLDSPSAILKLVPLNAARGPNSKCFTSVVAAAAEVRLLDRMQRVPGFVAFRGACVLQGRMPERLFKLWQDFRDTAKTVTSRDPSGGRAYPASQLWLLIEMADAGKSLEEITKARCQDSAEGAKGQRLEVRQMWDLWWQVVMAVAKAEVYTQFEHRDLHLGNICVKEIANDPSDAGEDLELIADDGPTHLPVNGTGSEVTIIDYTLSRARVAGKPNHPEEEVLFYDFTSDRNLLAATGELQYDMYRHMASAVGKRSCREFVPETNILWLWFVLKKLLDATMPLSAKARVRRKGCMTRTARMMEALKELEVSLDPRAMERWEIRSVGQLLDRGVLDGWFDAKAVMER